MQKKTSHKPELTVSVNISILFDDNGDDKDAANCLTSLENSMPPQIPRKIDDNYLSGSVEINQQNARFAVKEEASIIKMNSGNTFLNDSSKFVDLNICINNQNKVSFIEKIDTIKNALYQGNASVKNTALTAEKEESLNEAKNDIVVEKHFNEEGELNGSTESNKVMNTKERNNEESNEITEEDEFITAQKKQKNPMLIYQVMMLPG